MPGLCQPVYLCHQELWLLVRNCTQLHQHISGLELCACSCIIPAVLMTFQVLTWISGAGLAEGTNPRCKGWSGRALYPGVSH